MKNTPPIGPAPTRLGGDALSGLDPARARVLSAVRDGLAGSAGARDPAAAEGVTVGDVVDVLGGHPNTVRHHLSALLEEGLLEVAPAVAAMGRGRPATRYRTTARGEGAVGGGGLVEEYVALAAAFAERLADRGGDPGGDARTIGRAWGAALLAREAPSASRRAGRGRAGAPGPRARVLGILSRLGFSPATERPPTDGVTTECATTVLLRTCPLLESARRHPEVVCRVHLGLVEGVLGEGGGPGASRVGLEAFARPGACVLTLPSEAST